MGRKLQIKRGLKKDLPTLAEGEFGITLDEPKVYIGTGNKNISLARDDDIPSSMPANGGNSDTVNGHIVLSDVPANAKFTDTIYTHPAGAGFNHIPTGGSSGQILRWSANGTASWGEDKDTTYTAATTSSAGLMSAVDKTKLNSIANNANNYVHPTTAGNKHIPAGGASGQILRWSENGTAAWGNENRTTYNVATPSTNGLLSSVDKTKLDGIKAKAGTAYDAMILNLIDGNKADGAYSTAFNSYTSANGVYSSCFGNYTIANAYQLVMGRYNIDTAGPTSLTDLSGSLFVVGNGHFGAKSNAFRVETIGAVLSAGPFGTQGADYAEWFEWTDGNPNKEDRRGQFVTLDGHRIRLATAKDSYILGVVSSNPAIIGNTQDDQWQGMFLRDIYGAPILEEVMEPAYTDDEGIEHPAQLVTRKKVNPDYDAEQVYIPRSDRPEWAAIGMMGQLVVIDDGTCEVNSYCRPAVGGIATSAPDGPYRVMDRLDDTHIRVLFPGSGKI